MGAMAARSLALSALLAVSGCAAPYFAGQTGRVARPARRRRIDRAELSTVYYRGDARVFFHDRRLEGIALMPSVYVYGTY
jgi:hypothetical protein